MRFHAKTLYFKCVLLYLIMEDAVGAEKMFEKYCEDDPNLNNSYEKKFLTNILKVISEGDVEKFGDECFKLNSRMTMDKQLTVMLTEIKSKLKKADVMDDEYNPL